MQSERDKIVAWLRRQMPEDAVEWGLCQVLANEIAAGAHLRKPEPTIPASEWLKQPSVGYGKQGE